MRDIKFRAWEKEYKCMIYSDTITDEYQFIFSGGELKCFDYTDGFYSPLEIILMQYTGLKDKNGKEIYEGDILDFAIFTFKDGYEIAEEYKGVVKFNNSMFEIWKNNEHEFFGEYGAFVLGVVIHKDDELEVIGNIYENPELLEVIND